MVTPVLAARVQSDEAVASGELQTNSVCLCCVVNNNARFVFIFVFVSFSFRFLFVSKQNNNDMICVVTGGALRAPVQVHSKIHTAEAASAPAAASVSKKQVT